MDIIINGGILREEEIQNYVDYIQEKYPHNVLKRIEIDIDGEFVDLHYQFELTDFKRIRRITGYLVGDITRWNDAKTAEEKDRVKHL